MPISSSDLNLDHIYVVYPEGDRCFMSENIEAIPLKMILELESKVF